MLHTKAPLELPPAPAAPAPPATPPAKVDLVDATSVSSPEIQQANYAVPPPPQATDSDDTVAAQEPARSDVPMTLDEAVALTLAQNKDIQIQRFLPEISQRQVLIEDSRFDPRLSVGTQWLSNNAQITNIIQGPGGAVSATTNQSVRPPEGAADQLMISKQTRLGGEVSLGLSSNYQRFSPDGPFLQINPAVLSNISLEVSQPVFQGAGREIANIQIQMANNLEQSTRYELAIVIQQQVYRTVSAYWTLFAAAASHQENLKGVDEAYQAWKREEEKYKLGASATPNVNSTLEQLERFRIQTLQSERLMLDAEQELRLLLALPVEDGRRIIPATPPNEQPPQLHWDEALSFALQERPEIKLQRMSIQRAGLQHRVADDRLAPDVKAYGGLGFTGAGSTWGKSLNSLGTEGYENWWLGVVYEHPLGNRAARADHDRASLQLSMQRANLEKVEREVQTELYSARQHVLNAWQLIQVNSRRRDAADSVLVARRDMYELGQSSLQDYLMAMTLRTEAESDLHMAVADYNARLAEWEQAVGGILQVTSIQSVPPLEPGVQ